MICRPTEFQLRRVGRLNCVTRQKLAQRRRCTLVEQDSRLRSGDSALRGVLEYGPHLIERHAREPFDELADGRAVANRRQSALNQAINRRTGS